jgi:pilus assembly protein CpaC
LPTDAAVPPSRAQLLLGGQIEGTAPAAAPIPAPAAGSATAASPPTAAMPPAAGSN